MRWHAAVWIAPLVMALPLSAQRPVFRSWVNSVAVDVFVRQDGEPVMDLRAADFELSDNGVVQAISAVGRETLPIDVTLVADLSGSLDGPLLTSLKRAIGAVADGLRPADRASLVTFNQHIREVSALADGRLGVATGAIRSPGGLTSLVDALAASLIAPVDPTRRSMAIVFTDGKDVTSFLDEPDLIDLVARSGVTVFAVAITDGTSRAPRPVLNPALFRTLTETTGGALAVVQRDEDLGASFVQALADFRTSYMLRYAPAGSTSGGWHDLAVRVTRSGQFDVRARKGYFDTAVSAER